ncbi:hypothetical protein AQ490_25065 [Wenjunlia vitaminophila]|uniref:Aromatic acid exporter family member 1 n=1 Tax=Wenjunlia vitaminophila TaxID=76728 RepID=A0A0T6LR39_WENVI|nr:aromatic acid exporter family protein [Wenjunlia vitaminophila]KRV48541.1 hypothetical protein AQ490_25065 [Wenjunlia vitaminophila]
MRYAPKHLLNLVKRSYQHNPAVVQTVRATVAAVLAFAVAQKITGYGAPLLAPLTALLVVQVSLYATLTSGIRRINSVIAGVLIASGFSTLVNLNWWSLGVLIIASLVLGHLVRVDEYVPEVAISAMLVLGVSHVAQTAWGRVAETLIGAVTGVVFNALFVPPVLVEPAGEAIADLTTRMRDLLRRIGRELHDEVTHEQAGDWLGIARELDREIVQVDSTLQLAEESMRCNPRVRQGLLARLVLRSGLDSLEVFAVLLRVLCRLLSDLTKERLPEPTYQPELLEELDRLFNHLADAVESFGNLITAQISTNAERFEEELARALAAGRAQRDRISSLLVAESRQRPERWQVQGSLLTTVDQLLTELDVEQRSIWLAEQLDRYARHNPYPKSRLERLSLRFRTTCGPGWRGNGV